MRRVVVEIPLSEFDRVGMGDSMLSNIESAKMLQLLRYDGKEFSMILKMKFNDPSIRLEDLRGKDYTMQLLEEYEGFYTYFVKCKVASDSGALSFFGSDGYFTTPFELADGVLKLTFVGSAAETKRFLHNMSQSGVGHRVSSVSDARFSYNSPLNQLTEKQRRVLEKAYEMGYYSRPRGASSEQLAKQLDLSSSTLVNHRLKAERNLIAAVLDRE